MAGLLDLIRERHSARLPYDPTRKPPAHQLRAILEAASWAPTAHNMQNFEILLVDDPVPLQRIAAISTKPTAVFLRENFQQLSFSEEELRRKKTGVLASVFPPPWRTPGADFDAVAAAAAPVPLSESLHDCCCLMLVLYDSRRRAPASEGDVLGFMSLGCVMQNMWLAAQSLGIGLQILSVFSSGGIEEEMRRILEFPRYLKIAYGCRLGYPTATADYPRVRREVDEFTHHNRYGRRGLE